MNPAENKIPQASSPVNQKHPTTTYIYTLEEPHTNEVRYIGKTDFLAARFACHISERCGCHKCNWIAALSKKGLKPKMDVLEEVDILLWREAEKFWIETLRFLGCRLVNGTSGGDGVSATPDILKKMSDWQIGRKLSRETRDRISKARIGMKATDEVRLKLSLASKGKSKSVSHRRNISIGQIGCVRKNRASRFIGVVFRKLDQRNCPLRIRKVKFDCFVTFEDALTVCTLQFGRFYPFYLSSSLNGGKQYGVTSKMNRLCLGLIQKL